MLVKNIHPDFQRERLSPHFVYESYDEESGLFYNRGSVGFVLIANPLPGADLTAEAEIADFIANKENLPNGSSIQILNIGSSDIRFLLERWKNERVGDVYQEMAKRRCEFLAMKAKKEGIIRDSHLLISVTVPDLKTDLIAMEQRREALKGTFKSIGLWTEDVDANLLLSLLRKIWGRESVDGSEMNPHASLSEQILPGDFCLFEENDIVHLKDGESFISLDAEKRPGQWSLPLMDLFLGCEARRGESMTTDYLIHVGIQLLPNQTSSKTRIFTKREAISKNIKAGMGRFFADLQEEGEDIDGAVVALQSGDRVVHIHTNVILKGETAKVKLAAKAYSAMMRRKGWDFLTTRYDHLALMLNSMPMCMVEAEEGLLRQKVGGVGVVLGDIGRGKQTVSGESKVLMPIVGEYKGDLNAPGLLLTGRRGQLKFFSQFGGELTPHLRGSVNSLENYNIAIAGVSGSGKSVLMEDIMLSTLGVGGKVFVLDHGRSFDKLCQALDGSYFEPNPSSPVSINPFSEVPMGDDKVSVEARASFLARFPITLSTMACPKHGTSDLQQANLTKALGECWNAKNINTEIDDIANWLLAQENNDVANDLGRMFVDYVEGGRFCGFFKGKAKVKLDSDIVVIETDHLRDFDDLMAVIMQIMTVHINNAMAKGSTDKPNLLVFDEIVKTLSNPLTMKFVEKTARIVRKYKASVMVATQHLTDFCDLGKDAESIFKSSSFKLIMKQEPIVLTAMRSIPLLESYVKTDELMRRMLSVESKKHVYGEFTLWGGGVKGDICRLYIDPFTLLLMTTDADEKELIQYHRDNGLSLSEAINKILSDKESANA
jgi:conjugal transfer ATP-binding protein TraC